MGEAEPARGPQLERSFLRVPFECLNSAFRKSQRTVEKQIQALTKNLNEICANKQGLGAAALHAQLEKVSEKLRALRAKLDHYRQEERGFVAMCGARLRHLRDPAAVSQATVGRLIVGYLLRQGFFDVAALLAERHGLQQLVDSAAWRDAHQTVAALRRQDCSRALKWCRSGPPIAHQRHALRRHRPSPLHTASRRMSLSATLPPPPVPVHVWCMWRNECTWMNECT